MLYSIRCGPGGLLSRFGALRRPGRPNQSFIYSTYSVYRPRIRFGSDHLRYGAQEENKRERSTSKSRCGGIRPSPLTGELEFETHAIEEIGSVNIGTHRQEAKSNNNSRKWYNSHRPNSDTTPSKLSKSTTVSHSNRGKHQGYAIQCRNNENPENQEGIGRHRIATQISNVDIGRSDIDIMGFDKEVIERAEINIACDLAI